jgi:Rrf2 family transcriptional regulator, cysteine metabolism repressor
MRLSAKGDYALRALIDLAYHYDRRLVQTHEIAINHRIPEKFLEQILRDLKNSRIVVAKSGKQGGYKLARPPSEITFGEVIRLIDGPLAPIDCVSVKYYVPCPIETECKFQMVMRRVRNAVSEIIDHTTLADVAQGAPVIDTGEQMVYDI